MGKGLEAKACKDELKLFDSFSPEQTRLRGSKRYLQLESLLNSLCIPCKKNNGVSWHRHYQVKMLIEHTTETNTKLTDRSALFNVKMKILG